MSAELPGIRPAVLGRETRNRLDAYRGFRHIVRNVYAFNLKPSRLYELADDLPASRELVRLDVEAFCKFLETLG
jgi:hypothetical protein